MIYRFKSKLALQDRLEAFPVPSLEPDSSHYGPWFTEYEEHFKNVKGSGSLLGKIAGKFSQASVPFIGCQQFEAPCYLDARDGLSAIKDKYGKRKKYSLSYQFHLEQDVSDLPDLWSVGGYIIVSAKARAVIESVDQMVHEYLPFSWLSKDRELLDTDQSYYWFNPRRFFTIEPSARIAGHDELGFFPLDEEEEFLARVIDTPELQQHLSQFPLWRHYRLTGVDGRHSQARMVVYFNAEFYSALQDAGVKGIECFSQPFGVGEESVSHVGNGLCEGGEG